MRQLLEPPRREFSGRLSCGCQSGVVTLLGDVRVEEVDATRWRPIGGTGGFVWLGAATAALYLGLRITIPTIPRYAERSFGASGASPSP